MLSELIRRNRSVRRFHQDIAIDEGILRELVNNTRHIASAANLQPLRYMLSCEPERNAKIFAQLSWAGYLEEWTHPPMGEQPAAYIVMLGDTETSKSFGCDHGIAAQTILLAAVEKGLGGCMVGAINRQGLRAALAIPQQYEILLIIALGKPREKVVIEPLPEDGSIEYWRDADGVHHVPKRALNDIILP